MEQRHALIKKGITTLSALALLASLILAGAGWADEWPKDVNVISPAPGASVHRKLDCAAPWRTQTMVAHDESRQV